MANVIRLRDCEVDLDRMYVRRGDEEFALTSLEARLLRSLCGCRGEPISQETLLTEVWGYAPGVKSKAVYLTVHRLRKKLEQDPGNPVHLITVPHQGLALVGVNAATRSNLRTYTTSFIDRERVSPELRGALLESRLVTLVGTGGVGKTRLASRFASECAQDGSGWPGGACFCDCSGTRSADELLQVVADVLHVRLAGDDSAARIGRALASRGVMLVVLDNLEQVVQPAAALASRWLSEAPKIRVLATSRRALGLDGERVIELESMSVDEGVQLFLERARQINPGFCLDPRELETLKTLVAQRLDGLPLAIELAAARTGVLGLAQIEARMEQRFQLLRARGRFREARHEALQDTIGWSWMLLEPPEQAALAACSVFRGGFDQAGAAAVIGPEAAALLQRLEGHSLIERHSGRWRLLDSIRDYAQLKLCDPEIVPRHRAHYLKLGHSLVAALQGPGAVAAHAAMLAERQNLLAAYERALQDAPEQAVEVALVLDLLYVRQGYRVPHKALLDGAIAAAEGLGDAVRADLYRRRGDLMRWLDHAQARADLARALALARAAGARRVEAQALGTLGAMEINAGDLREAEQLLRGALVIYRELGDVRGEGITHTALSQVVLGTQDIRAGEEHLRTALGMLREIGEPWLEADVLNKLSVVLKERGDEEGRRRCLEAALSLAEYCGSSDARFDALIGLGNYNLDRGDWERAAARYSGALTLAQRTGDPAGVRIAGCSLLAVRMDRGDLDGAAANARLVLTDPQLSDQTRVLLLTMLGMIARLAGRTAEALEHLQAAARRAGEQGNLRMLSYARLHLGPVLADLGRLEEADELLRSAEESYRDPLDPVGLAMAAVGRAHLSLARGDRAAARAVLEEYRGDESQEVRRVTAILSSRLS